MKFFITVILTILVVGGGYAQRGTTGDLTWSIADGILTIEPTISGTTAQMPNYHTNTPSPWKNYISDITSINILEGVTTIGNNAFYGCEKITTLTIPEGVSTIGSYALFNCMKLAFISIPKSMTSFGNEVWGGCFSLVSIEVHEENNNYKSQDGILYDKLMQSLIKYPAKKAGAAYLIPESVNTVVKEAFYHSTLIEYLFIPQGVTNIEGGAFVNCAALTTIEISPENSAYRFLNGALFDKEIKTLVLCLPNKKGAYFIPESVTRIAYRAFNYCNSFSVYIPAGVTDIEDYAFGSSSLKELVVMSPTPPKAKSNTFISLSSRPVYVPENSLEEYENNVYWKKLNLKEFKGGQLSETKMIWTLKGNTLVVGTANPEGEDMPIFNDVFSAPWYSHHLSIKEVDILEGVTNLGNYSFHKCDSIVSVKIPESVVHIGRNAFSNCKSLTSIAIPKGVTGIQDEAFANCSKLTSITIPTETALISGRIFSGCTMLTSINVDEGNSHYKSENGVLFNKAKTTLLMCPEGKAGTYFIPAEVATIDERAFACCNALISITIPQSMKNIKEYAFADCTALEEIIVMTTVPPAVTTTTFYNFSTSIPVYVSQENITEYQNNPIWRTLNLQSKVFTNIPEKQLKDIFIFTQNNEIIITGVDQPQVIVYDINGKIINSCNMNRILVPKKGIYMVRIAREIFKIIVI